MLPETVEKLSRIANIVALKEACGNTDQVTALKALLPNDDFIIYSGDDSLTLPILSVGGYGVISVASHVAGKLICQMIAEFINGRIEEAGKLHVKLYPLFKAMFVTTNPIPVKRAVSLLGWPSGKPRLPLVEASSQETATISNAMAGLGLI